MDPTVELMRQQWYDNVRQMYWTYERAKAERNQDKQRELMLIAASHGDFVIDACTWFKRGLKREMILVSDNLRVSYAEAENAAYNLLKQRAQMTETNPFEDTGARWFV